MKSYRQELEQKTVSIPQALDLIPDGALVVTGAGSMEPMTLLGQLHTIAPRINEVTLYGGGGRDPHPYLLDPAYRDKFFVQSNFYSPRQRTIHPEGRVSLIPLHLHASYDRYREVWQPDVIISASGPMDEHGYFNLSLEGWCLECMDTAKTVILEILDDAPRIGGQFYVHISEVTAVVPSGRKLSTVTETVPGPLETTIGEYIATLVEDGSTFQLGVGKIPDAAARALKDKKDLGVHSEMLCTSMKYLADIGALTNRKKTLHRGMMIGTFASGTREFYDWLDGNPTVFLLHPGYVNDPRVIAKNDKMVSINSCLEVDLTGQIASESIGTRQYAGSGGQNDFAEGAIHSKGGKSIIAMPSAGVDKEGRPFSKIKPILTPGAIVTMSRNNIDYIVTEYGIAPMKALTVRQRVDNLIAIAHPDFREELRREASRLMIW